MIEYKYLIDNVIFTSSYSIVSFKLFLFVLFALIVALLIDILFGELPAKIHPVVIIGSLISFFKNIFIKIKNRLSGLLTVICVIAVSSVILYVIYFIQYCSAVYCLFCYFILNIFDKYAFKDCN